MDEQQKKKLIWGESPESISFKEIKEIVIPGLRQYLNELLESPKETSGFKERFKFYCQPTQWNYKSHNIVERALAVCGDTSKMSGYELNDSVKILREEIYLVQLQIQQKH